MPTYVNDGLVGCYGLFYGYVGVGRNKLFARTLVDTNLK
jgi:hypothetical protein